MLGIRGRLTTLYAVLFGANVAAWLWALLAFRAHPVLLGTAALAYGFGLRHAVDADHIAAIDNVTRKLMQDGRRPVAVGFFFSLGHSTIVVTASAAIAATAARFEAGFNAVRVLGGVFGTVISAAFLFAIALMNLAVLASVRARLRRLQAGDGTASEGEPDPPGGPIARLCRPLFGLIGHSWQMFPLGLLFGLGFDTATEVGLLGLSAAQATTGLSVWSILVFPALFTAGMSLIDTTDGVLMLGAYGWAVREPVRKLHYDMTITLASILVALLVAGIETLGLLADRLALHGRGWSAVADLQDHFGSVGVAIIGAFSASWALSVALHRIRR